MIINYQGKSIEVEEIDVLTEKELWNEYQLSNGDVLSIKLILIKVIKAYTEKSPDGLPLYIVRTQNVVKVKGVKE